MKIKVFYFSSYLHRYCSKPSFGRVFGKMGVAVFPTTRPNPSLLLYRWRYDAKARVSTFHHISIVIAVNLNLDVSLEI